MRAGSLRHRITLQVPVENRLASGEIETIWQDGETIWGSIEPISGREYFAAAQVQSEITARIRLRWRPNVTSRMRVKHERFGGSPSVVELYDIEAVLDIEGRARELHLMCRRRDGHGFKAVGANGE